MEHILQGLIRPGSDTANEAVTGDGVFKFRDNEFNLNERTHIMGVLNLTPDSFYDGGKYTDTDIALRRVESMVSEGADIVDIGGESTRPGSDPVSDTEELNRVIPVIREIRRNFDIPLSIDTTKSVIARQALSEGASIINDISGLMFDSEIADIAAEYKAGLVVMHTPSRPKNMQSKTSYSSLLSDVARSLMQSVNTALDRGVSRNSIIIDPGFGFGKTAEQNLIILKNLRYLIDIGYPVLISTSNKSFIGKILDKKVTDRTEGTAATVAIGIQNGASIIRVHDTGFMKLVSRMVDSVMRVS